MCGSKSLFTGLTIGVALPAASPAANVFRLSVFAMRKELEIPPDPWDVPRFRLARFEKGRRVGYGSGCSLVGRHHL
jgi:hypothetical protein